MDTTESAEEFIKAKSAKWKELRKHNRPGFKSKDIGRQGHHVWFREAWTFHVQHNYPVKVLSIERLRLLELPAVEAYPGPDVGAIEYRFGYWTVGRNGNARDRWVWGQFSPFIPQEDIGPLLEKAQSEGTLKVPERAVQ